MPKFERRPYRPPEMKEKEQESGLVSMGKIVEEHRKKKEKEMTQKVLGIRRGLEFSDPPAGAEDPYEGLNEEQVAQIMAVLQEEIEYEKNKPENIRRREMQKRLDKAEQDAIDSLTRWNIENFGWTGEDGVTYKGPEAWRLYRIEQGYKDFEEEEIKGIAQS